MSKKSAIAILNKQFKELMKNPIDGFFVGLKNDNISGKCQTNWHKNFGLNIIFQKLLRYEKNLQ